MASFLPPNKMLMLMDKKYEPIFSGLKVSSEEVEILTTIFFRIRSSIGKIPMSLYLERFYDGRLKKYYFNFEECKSSFNDGELVVRPIYKYGRRKNNRKAKRNFSITFKEVDG